MPALSEKTPVKLDLKTVVAVAFAIAGAAGTITMARADISDLRHRVTEQGSDLRAVQSNVQENRAAADAGLGELKQRLIRLEERQDLTIQLLQEVRQAQERRR